MTGFYADDPERLSYPQAEQITARYVRLKQDQRASTTTVDVLRWSDYPNDHHNRLRVHAALKRVCDVAGETASGRTMFDIPTEQL